MLMAHSSCLLAVCTSGVIEGHTSERKRNFSKQKKTLLWSMIPFLIFLDLHKQNSRIGCKLYHVSQCSQDD